MSTEAFAIVGLTFWLISHGYEHTYQRRPSKAVLALWLVTAFISLGFLLVAVARVWGWLS